MEPKTSVKSVAADQITVNVPVKIIGGEGGGGRVPLPSPRYGTVLGLFIKKFIILILPNAVIVCLCKASFT